VTSTGGISSCQSGIWVGQGVGAGQNWSSPGYGFNTVTYNTTNKPIYVSIYGACGSVSGEGNFVALNINGVDVGRWYASFRDNASGGSAGGVVPRGAYFYAYTNSSLCSVAWAQLS